MSPGAGFLFFLALTLALLAGVVATGLRARRRIHLVLVALALASLGTTIYFAEKLGGVYDVQTAGWITPTHLLLAKVATASYLLPIVSGIATLRQPRFRPWHRRFAWFVLAMTLLTAVTGTWMLLASDPVLPTDARGAHADPG